VIVEQGFRSHSIGKPGLVTSTDHDGRVFAEAMSKAMGAVPLAPVFEMKVAIEHVDVDQLAERAASFSTDGIVLRMPPDAVDAFLQALKAAGLNVPIFLPWIPGLPRKEIIAAYDGPVYAVQVLDHAACPEKDRFAARYRQAYSGEPSVAAILGYDATNILMEATGIGGLSRAGIRQALWDLSGYPGISGRIRWDNGGGNDRKPELVRLRVADFELCE